MNREASDGAALVALALFIAMVATLAEIISH
jgi:hypothetical protein